MQLAGVSARALLGCDIQGAGYADAQNGLLNDSPACVHLELGFGVLDFNICFGFGFLLYLLIPRKYILFFRVQCKVGRRFFKTRPSTLNPKPKIP